MPKMVWTLSAPPELTERSFMVLYSTVTGSSSDVADRIARSGRRRGWRVTVKGVAEFNQLELLETPLIVFVLPTTGNGAAPPSFVPLWTALLHPSLPSDFLEDLRYAVFALGDSSYGKYNWVGKKMSRRLDALGATAVVDRGEGDDQNEWGIESTFPAWMDTFFTAIEKLAPPLPAELVSRLSLSPIPPPRIQLDRVADETVRMDPAPPPWASDVRSAKVKRIERTTARDWYQDVRSVELEIEGFEDEQVLYEAGDVLEIRPQNSAEDVQRFLTSVGWTDIADELYSIRATSPDQPLPPHLPSPYVTTLRHLLTHEVDIGCVPRLSFFEWLADFSEGDMEEKLREFCKGEGQDDLIDYTIRPRRTINEVMYEFRAAKVPPEYVLDLLPPMRARGFSISSSPTAHEGKVDLLVAIVAYKTILSVPRKGVCTSYIATLSPGDRLPVRFDTSGILRLPPGKPPLIMVGPGTGVAPFRALMEERRRVGAKENLLFFGCRSVEKDFHFESEWQQMVKAGDLTLSVAASRDQDDKIYVQHRIPEYSAQIWDYLSREGLVYLCGSSTNMPKAVKKALLAVFASEGGLDSAAAEQYWDELEKAGRIVEETWG